MSARRSFDAVKEPLVTCSMCTAGQITELECSGCDKWMGLDNFAKAQRRKPDQAVCATRRYAVTLIRNVADSL